MKNFLRNNLFGGRLFRVVVTVLLLALAVPVGVASAATTADVTVTATPQVVAIADNTTTYDFGPVATSSTTDMPTGYVEIDNTSSVQTDQTISTTSANWTGGMGWENSDTATVAPDIAGLKASKGTGAFDVIIKSAAPNYIAENQAANTDYTYEVRLLAPTSFGDGVQKTITIRVTAAAG